MPRQETATCPSGLKLLIRNRIAKDYDILAGVDSNVYEATNRYIEAFVLETIDRGPYAEHQFYKDGRPKCDGDFLMGDFWYLMLKQHDMSYPDSPLTFTYRCAVPGCEGRTQVKSKLGDEDSDGTLGADGVYHMRVLPMYDDEAETFSAGNEFEWSLNGTKLWYRLATRGSSRDADRHVARAPDTKITSSIASRIVRVDGVDNRFTAIRDWVGGLDDDEVDGLWTELESRDFGVDMTVQVECPGVCNQVHEVDVEVDPGFLVRERRQRKRRSRKR
jgi:hypothetical protein